MSVENLPVYEVYVWVENLPVYEVYVWVWRTFPCMRFMCECGEPSRV